MAFYIEHDDKDQDYRIVIIRLSGGYMRHRCGYVSVPKDHPFFGKPYSHKIPFDCKNAKVQVSNPIGTFLAAYAAEKDDTEMEISYAADVHGGITFSDGGTGYPIKDIKDDWWFGFDAAHCDDNADGGQPLEYMINEANRLRDFLKKYDGHIALAA